MGAVCQPDQRKFKKTQMYIIPPTNHILQGISRQKRFGDIQKIRTKRDDVFKLIMTTNYQLPPITIQCRILTSSADFQLYDGTKFEVLDQIISPVIDAFDPNQHQIYHPIINKEKKNLMLKVYPFYNYRDDTLKNGLYQISLYLSLNSVSPLYDFFIMSRGKLNSLVMIFKRYQISLYEILVYRQLADNFYWTYPQILTLWKSLIISYKQLNNSSIYHRDIRLSKILYTLQSTRYPYQFINLYSAKKIAVQQQFDDLMTVVGVNIFAEEPMRQHIQNNKDVGLCNPKQYDLKCLARVFKSIATLNPLEGSQNIQLNKGELNQILKKLISGNANLEQIERQIDLKLMNMDYSKDDLFKQQKIIVEHLTKTLLRQNYKDKIESSYLNALISLHKKQQFNQYLIKKIEDNQHQDRKQFNIQLLHKIGLYYDQIGLPQNQYYRQQFALLLELAKQCRQQYFYTDHSHYLKQISIILPHHQSLSSRNLLLKYYRELVFQFIYQEDLNGANRQFDSNLRQLQEIQQISVSQQVDTLILKVYLQILNKRFESGESLIQKISFFLGNNHLDSQQQTRRYQGQIEYLRSFYALSLMNSDYGQVKKKNISLAQVCLNNAINIFSNLPQSPDNTIKLIDTYVMQSDVQLIKSQYTQSKKYLEKAHLLSKQIQKYQPVSNILKLKLNERLKIVYEKLNLTQQPFYNEILLDISKNNQKKHSSNAAQHKRTKLLRMKADKGKKNILSRPQRLNNSIQQENEQQDD